MEVFKLYVTRALHGHAGYMHAAGCIEGHLLSLELSDQEKESLSVLILFSFRVWATDHIETLSIPLCPLSDLTNLLAFTLHNSLSAAI